MKKLIIVSLIIFTTNLLSGQIINIPADYPTIQQGINASNNGDTVLVETGTYYENINFNGNNITVASNYLLTLDESYIFSTIINGNQNGSVVKFESGEDTTAILSGFTITDGYNLDEGGGGIFVDSASPTLEYLNINFNEADGSGGGMYLKNSNSKLYNITVENNISNHGWTYYLGGGGIYTCLSNLIMDSLVVQFNEGWVGGGIKCDANSNLVITNSNISNNTAFGGGSPAGGGLCLYNCVIDIQNTIISNNTTLTSCAPFAQGGGMYISESTLGLSGVTIKKNEANAGGGGISFRYSEIVFDSINKCSIYDNKAPVGHDFYCKNLIEILEVILDTFSVNYPTDYYAEPYKYFDFDINYGLVQQIDADLYVSDKGSNLNSGQTEEEPLLSIQYALSILRVDSLHPHQVYLLPGLFSASSTQEYFPINIPEYCHLSGSNAHEVILNAEGWGNVINISNNNESDIYGIKIKGGKGGMTAGGISCFNSSPSFSNLIIEGNMHWNPAWMGQGGGLLLASSNPVLRNVLIANNYAWSGGGTYLRNSNPVFINCTFSGNSGNSGRGIYINGNSNVSLKNTIMWSDSLGEIRILNDDTTYASLSISWSDIHGGQEGIDIGETGTVYWLEGNINENPQFDIGGDHPYALSDQSPCIDVGTPDTTGLNLPIGDIIGYKRIWDGDNNGTAIIDMGGYEYGSIPVNINNPIPVESLNKTKLEIFPNPFSQSTTIKLAFKEKRKMALSIYNQLGEKVETIFKGEKEKGRYKLTWNSKNLSSGIYFIQLQTDKGITIQKIIKK